MSNVHIHVLNMEYFAFNDLFLTLEHLYDTENLNNVEHLIDVEHFYDVVVLNDMKL